MYTLVSVLHVVGAVVIVGPMAVLPMVALRAVRAGSAPVVVLMARSTRVFSVSVLLLLVAVTVLMVWRP